ncbi:MAG: hemerythrin domain-containing protein [Nocardioidaceae bacterium]|nr:hemerythrin domain-containing protein [Nocardioidaceae bacterium]MCL2614220.1 hemerythrin domain-containing protein [Nocardioidaceae bacterium]
MGDAIADLKNATTLPEGDVVRLLLEQHERIRRLFEELRGSIGTARADLFAELRAGLTVHETAEQLVVRPASKELAGEGVAEARLEEEQETTGLLADLDRMAVTDPEFHQRLVTFEEVVERHLAAEEREELPPLLAGSTPEERQRMGRMLTATERLAPTRPHPTTTGNAVATVVTAPVASVIDRARDAMDH